MTKYVYHVEYDGRRWGVLLSGQKLASAKQRSSAIKLAVLLAARKQRLGQDASFEVKERGSSQNKIAWTRTLMASSSDDFKTRS